LIEKYNFALLNVSELSLESSFSTSKQLLIHGELSNLGLFGRGVEALHPVRFCHVLAWRGLLFIGLMASVVKIDKVCANSGRGVNVHPLSPCGRQLGQIHVGEMSLTPNLPYTWCHKHL
jgi:hypothetical protein